MKEYIEREAALEVVHDDEVVLAASAEARRIIREKLEELPATYVDADDCEEALK